MLTSSTEAFDYEYQMIPHIESGLISSLSSLNSCKHVLTGHEMSLGWGVADLVMSPRDSFTEKKPLTSLMEINVLTKLDSVRLMNIDELSAITLLDRNILMNNVISQLLDFGYVEEVNSKYRKIYDLEYSKSKNVIAVEAKLRDWRRAYKQALRYRLFADMIFVVLDKSNIKPLINKGGIELYEREGIGLASVTPNGDWDLLLHAKISQPFSRPLKLLAHQLLEQNGGYETRSK